MAKGEVAVFGPPEFTGRFKPSGKGGIYNRWFLLLASVNQVQ